MCCQPGYQRYFFPPHTFMIHYKFILSVKSLKLPYWYIFLTFLFCMVNFCWKNYEKNKKDYVLSQVWPGLTAFPDFFQPSAEQYWYNQIKSYWDKIPFNGIWIVSIAVMCAGLFSRSLEHWLKSKKHNLCLMLGKV